MTPKEKAYELYMTMLQWQDYGSLYIERKLTSISAKRCALITAEEVLNNLEDHTGEDTKYWNEVKNEINKL